MKPTTTPKPRVRATVACTVILRLDGGDPLGDLPESEDDYRREYAETWQRLNAYLRRINVEPFRSPPEGYWKVDAFYAFHPNDIAAVVKLLGEVDISLAVSDLPFQMR